MIEVKGKIKKAKPEMVDLFSINGKVYQMLARPSASLGLKYLQTVRTSGPFAAEMELLEAVTPEGYQALVKCEDLDRDDLVAITLKAIALAFGHEADSGEAGNVGSGSTS